MLKLTQKQLRIFPRIQRKYNVSVKFLRYNIANIEKFLWYALSPRLVIKRVARRKGPNQRVVLDYYHLRRVLFDQTDLKYIKSRKRNVQQWSRQIVGYLRSKYGSKEYVEDVSFADGLQAGDINNRAEGTSNKLNHDVSKQMKEQLELLRSGKRTVPLMESVSTDTIQNTLETTPEKQLIERPVDASNIQNCKKLNPGYHTDRSVDEEGDTEQPTSALISNLQTEKNVISNKSSTSSAKAVRGNSNFLDMLMNKVCLKQGDKVAQKPEPQIKASPCKPLVRQFRKSLDNGQLTDSSEEFYGFDETEFMPGMMRTPVVPHASKSKTGENTAFVSESLNEFMRENLLESTENKAIEKSSTRKHRQANLDGLVTTDCVPPHLDMPLVPESLQKLRTVAERRQYLQKFSKNHKLAIINNEATISRELQRKTRNLKSKSASQQMLQAPNSSMSFTRQGWQAASFVATEFNHYFYQILDVDNGKECVRLPGVRGNNQERSKRPYQSRVLPTLIQNCTNNCIDALIWRGLKPIRSESTKKRLNKAPLPTVFKPCPLSRKPFQKPLDDETAPLLLAGGTMTVVRMPTVELEVFPAIGKPLHEVAKRYLQYIKRNEVISREWAEFSVSTLQQSNSSKNDETSSDSNSYVFPVPYLNDRSHVLVRRVVNRSEKLDESFEMAKYSERALLENLSFRQNLDQSDDLLMECADVISDMINCVAISCSENSFIEEDPDVLCAQNDLETEKMTSIPSNGTIEMKNKEKTVPNKADDGKTSPITSVAGSNKKQTRLLLELRRLNATIIDAGVKADKETKPCSKDYCRYGCVCASLADGYPVREHCGKAKCVVDCVCRGSNQSRIMRLEHDGRSITTEDAFMLRRKATERLARMEKEFTSTVVLTGNETLLINESQYDKKRRCTKVPKRYDDFADTDDDVSRTSVSPQKKSAFVTIESAENASPNVSYSGSPAELCEPIHVQENVLSQLKHCTVALVRLEDTNNLSTWCMVHELYKCFCGGRALEGKPLTIERDSNATISHLNVSNVTDDEHVIVPTKARYSFEKIEEVEAKAASKIEEEKNNKVAEQSVEFNADDEESLPSGDDADADYVNDYPPAKKLKTSNSKQKRGRPAEANYLAEYFSARPTTCRRIIPVPHKTYKRMNRKRRAEILEFIERNENEDTTLLLNEHVLRSVYFHKHEVEKQKKDMKTKEVQREPENKLAKMTEKSSQQNQRRDTKSVMEKKQVKELGSPRKNLEPKEHQIVDLTDEDTRQSSISSSKKIKPPSRRKQTLTQLKQLSRKRPGGPEDGNLSDEVDLTCTIEQHHNTEASDTLTTAPFINSQLSPSKQVRHKRGRRTPIQSEEIARNVEKGQDICRNDSDGIDLTCTEGQPQNATLHNILASTIPTNPPEMPSTSSVAASGIIRTGFPKSRLDFFKEVVNNMNSLVNKKMQDIGMALKRESKVIPPPNDDILCIITWMNFLEAFLEGYVFLWQVKTKDNCFIAATIKEIMPLVNDAVAVMELTSMDINAMPIMGKMLTKQFRNGKTRDLAIVMQGRPNYWLVRGFLRSDKLSACSKPTPKTHPLLTRKINLLSSLLAKQHMRELQNKMSKPPQENQQQQDQRPRSLQQQRRTQQQPQSMQLQQKPPQLQQHLPSTRQGLKSIQQQPPQLQQQSRHLQQQQNSSMVLQHSVTSNSDRFTNLNDILTLQQPLSIVKSVAETCSKKANSTDQSQQPMQGTPPQSATKNSQITPQPSCDFLNIEQYTNMQTNIEFRKVTTEDIDEMQQFDICQNNHRWLVLELYSDFSHVFVPEFRDLIALDRIQKVMSFCRQKQKIVRLQFYPNAPFDAFVTPKSRNKVYFGPLKMERQLPLLILLQSVDKQMMLREVYQAQHNIQPHPIERTTAFWILCIDGQYQFQADNDLRIPREKLVTDQVRELYDSDDDCMIVDDTGGSEKAQTENRVSISVKPLEKLQQGTSQNQRQLTYPIQTVTDSHRQQKLQDDKSAQPTICATNEKHQDGSLQNHRQLTNFTIQTSADSNRLQIMQINNNVQTSKSSEQQLQVVPSQQLQNAHFIPIQMPLNAPLLPLSCATTEKQAESQLGLAPLLNLPANAVITSVALTPPQQEVPYGTTIYISSMPPQNNTNTVSISEVNGLKPTVADPLVTSEPTKVTFLTPDVCVTGTEVTGEKFNTVMPVTTPSIVTEKSNTQTVLSAAKPNWELPVPTIQIVKAHENEVAEKNTSSETQHDSLSDGQINSKKVPSIRDMLNTSTGALPKVNIKSTINFSADAKAILQRANDKPRFTVNPNINLKTSLKSSAAIVGRRKTIADSALISSKRQELQTLTVVTPKENGFKNVSKENTDATKATDMESEERVNPLEDAISSVKDTQAEPTVKAVNKNLPNISTIGSTTITKLDDAVVKRIKPTDPHNMTLTLAGDAFEPAASIVFKRNPFVSEENSASDKVDPKPSRYSLPPYKRTASGVLKVPTTTTTGAANSIKAVGKNTSNRSEVLVLEPKKFLSGNRSVSVTTKRPYTVTSASTNTTTAMTPSTSVTTISQNKPTTMIGTKLSKPTVTTANISVVAAKTGANQKQRFILPATSATTVSQSVQKTIVNTTPAKTVSSANLITNISGLQLKRAFVKSITPVRNNVSNNASSPSVTNLTKLTPITLKKVASAGTSTVTSSNNKVTPAVVSQGEYGLFCCNHPGVQKFVGKRVDNYFLMKVPDVGTIHKRSLQEVSLYLTQYVVKTNPALKSAKSLTWRFFPRQINSVPTKSGDAQTSKMQQRLTNLKTVKKSPATLNTIGGNARKSATGAPPPKIQCTDTILIDD